MEICIVKKVSQVLYIKINNHHTDPEKLFSSYFTQRNAFERATHIFVNTALHFFFLIFIAEGFL